MEGSGSVDPKVFKVTEQPRASCCNYFHPARHLAVAGDLGSVVISHPTESLSNKLGDNHSQCPGAGLRS